MFFFCLDFVLFSFSPWRIKWSMPYFSGCHITCPRYSSFHFIIVLMIFLGFPRWLITSSFLTLSNSLYVTTPCKSTFQMLLVSSSGFLSETSSLLRSKKGLLSSYSSSGPLGTIGLPLWATPGGMWSATANQDAGPDWPSWIFPIAGKGPNPIHFLGLMCSPR